MVLTIPLYSGKLKFNDLTIMKTKFKEVESYGKEEADSNKRNENVDYSKD